MKHWTWWREALPELMGQLLRAEQVASPPVADSQALARAFWSWAGSLDAHAVLEPLDPVDYAHFQVGMLLAQLLQERPLRWQPEDRSEEVRMLTDTALTLLAAWLKAIDAAPLRDDSASLSDARWSSYVENVTEDASVAVAYLDLFTGREPVWNLPTMPTERPVLLRALAQRRATSAA